MADDCGVILVGCCGFPIRRASYVAEFPAVEVQQTFYQPPRPETAARWQEEAPPGFRFSLKAWQLITHTPRSPTYRRLREPLAGPEDHYGSFRPTSEVRQAWRRTLKIARALAAEVVVVQCPASFTPAAHHVADLRRFFSEAERDGLIVAWEPRGPWPAMLIGELCQELNLVHVVDPLLAEPAHGQIAYWRLHGPHGYRSRYDDAGLEALRQRCLRAASQKAVWVLFNNLSMLEDGRRLRKRLG